MTREEKIKKRKARAAKRAEKHNSKYRALVAKARYESFPESVPLAIVRNNGWWRDTSSPTGWRMKCSMGGTCQAPCNGDC